MKLIGFLDDNATEKHIRQTLVMLYDLVKQPVACLHAPVIKAYMFMRGTPPTPPKGGYQPPTERMFLIYDKGSFFHSELSMPADSNIE